MSQRTGWFPAGVLASKVSVVPPAQGTAHTPPPRAVPPPLVQGPKAPCLLLPMIKVQRLAGAGVGGPEGQ